MQKFLKNHGVIKLGSDSKVNLTIDECAEVWIEDIKKNLRNRVVKIRLKPGAVLHFMTYSAGESIKIFDLDTGSHLDYYHGCIGNANDEATVNLNGEGSSAVSQTIFFGHKAQSQNLRLNHVHRGKNTSSKMISRGSVKDSAHCKFFGTINMGPRSNGANGILQEHNLILSSNAKIEATPALEIKHSDVSASHSATLERIDDEKLFYLRSRGLSEKSSLELLVEGFFLDALKNCPNLAFSDKIFKDILECLSK